jgi:hypothetical protein
VRTKTHKYIRNLQHDQPYTSLFTATETPAKADDKDMADLWLPWVAKAEAGDAFAKQRVGLYRNRPPEELYDLVNDPYELNNVIDNPDYASIKKELSDRIDIWMRQQSDTGTCDRPGSADPGPGTEDPQGPTGVVDARKVKGQPAIAEMPLSAIIPRDSRVTIFSANGRVVRRVRTADNTALWRIGQGLAKGVYTVVVQRERGVSRMRLALR